MNKIKLIAIAKNEGAYLAEWIHHHLYFGFDGIEIIYNQCTDNTIDILKKISNSDSRLTFSCGDALFSWSSINGLHFQGEAYKYAYFASCYQYSHVMFLDLDEYWTPADFSTSIKDVIQNFEGCDSISFAWHTDLPERFGSFSGAFKPTLKLQKNRHVKSILSTRKIPKAIDVHNSTFIDGVYKLFDGSIFGSEHADCKNYSILSPDFFNEKITHVDDYFIFHRIYKSEIEYLSSLNRGRPIPGALGLLKDNRWGYLPMSDNGVVEKVLPEFYYSQYQASLFSFIFKLDASSELLKARESVVDRANEVIRQFEDDAVYEKYKHLLVGLSAKSIGDRLSVVKTVTCLDSVTFGAEINFSGWAFDESSGQALRPSLRLDVAQKIAYLIRPDVSKKYSIANVCTGYSISMGCEVVKSLSSVWLDFYLDDQLVVSENIKLTDFVIDKVGL